jgi:hypothetical protein
MKVRALKRGKIMKGKVEILTPSEFEMSIWYVIKNNISSFRCVEWKNSDGLVGKRNAIALGKISYIDDDGKRKTLKEGAIVFEKTSDFATFLSSRYIPEGRYPVDELIFDIKRKVKGEKRRKSKIQYEIIDALYSPEFRDERRTSLGPFYIKKEENLLGEKIITLLGKDEYIFGERITLTELPFFKNMVFSKPVEDKTSVILRKYSLDIRGKRVPYSRFLIICEVIKVIKIKINIMFWDGNKFQFGFIDDSGTPFDEKLDEIDSGGEIYSSEFFEYLPIPRAEVKFVVRIPSWNEIIKLRIDVSRTVEGTPPVKDTVYMIDTLSAITPEQLSSAKVVIDDPEEALRIFARTYSKIFVPDDAPSSILSLPEDELYLAGVVI